MPGREWLPIEAWLHSGELLSKVLVKEDGEIEDEDSSVSRTCFSSSRLGEGALESDVSQETLMFSMHPEMLAQCLWTECLEDNEALHIEGLQRISTLKESDKVVFDPGVPTYLVGHHNIVTICIDAEDYSDCPLKQYEEDNILRELNKSYLGYCDVYKPLQNPENSQLLIRRSQLKPIKDEVASEKSDKKQYFTETVKAGVPTKNSCPVVIAMIPKKSVASKETTKKCAAKDSGIQNEVRKELWPYMTSNDLTSNENVEFCVNSSEGEMSRSNVDDVTCRRRPSLVELSDTHKSIYKTCNSELDDFKSANSSLDVEDVLDTSNDISRQLFFDRLSKVLRKERTNSETESGYAVDLVLDSPDGNDDIQQRLVRESSRGFVLKSEENDQDFFSDEGLERERKWLKHFREKSWNSRAGSSLDKDNASRYSFSSDFTSDLEEKYDNGPDLFDESSEKDPIRSDIVAQFANRLLKRTFSDSYLRVADELGSIPEKPHQKDICMKSESDFKILLKYHSLDEEALCDNTYGIDCHKDADDLIQMKPIATGNWGCGANQKGDPQLKALVQWVAASKAGAPYLIYFTKRDPSLKQLKAVIEAVSSKGWTVGQLTGAILTYCQTTIASILGTSPRLRKEQQSDLFQYIIGMPATEL
ncbi:uncharacterized protein LOC136038949 isoform X2 [Artemia franciscana]|uniref:uncharacterized protein LOC136038949 isoform X2 n=1 Tax=Artemia franciscana TaxID=6661 RepID=UPI0032DB13EF